MKSLSLTRSSILAGLALTTALAGSAAAAELSIPSGTYAVDPGHTSVFWTVNHFGLSNYTARFNTADATIELNADDVSQSTLTATVDMGSVSTSFPFPEQHDFDATLQGGDWLNVSEFPQATFTSTSIEVTGDDTALISGDLTFLGQTLPMTFETTLVGVLEAHPMNQNPAFGIQAVGTFDRTDFGLATFAPAIGTDVTITINAEFQPQ